MNAEMADSFAWLADANAYRTNDLDAARHYIGEIFVPHRLEVLGHRQVLDVCIGRAGIDGVFIRLSPHRLRRLRWNMAFSTWDTFAPTTSGALANYPVKHCANGTDRHPDCGVGIARCARRTGRVAAGC